MTNLSKQKREELVSKIKEIRTFLSRTAGQDKNAGTLLTYLSDLEKEVKGKKYGLVFEEHRERIDDLLETHVPVLMEEESLFIDNGGQMNFLIEGDNLAALHLLQKTHEGKIDLIYIDPPYNTGAKDWKYDNNYVDKNDSFRHSKWLSMMNVRLEIAKTLLKKNGVLICAIDKHEQATLGLLLERVFGDSHDCDCITIVHNPRGVQGKNFSYVHEYAFFVHKKGTKNIGMRRLNDDDVDWSPLRNWGGESLRSDAKNCFYSIIVENGEIVGFGDVVTDENFHPESQTVVAGNQYWIYPIDTKGIERKWRYARQTVESIKNILSAKKTKKGYDILIGKQTASYKTVWADTRYDANQYGTQIISELLGKDSFDFPKSLWNVYDCIYSVVGLKKRATILDFFAGSGTTGHAVMQLNAEDGGKRKFILCTNNENNICREVTYERVKRVIERDGYAASLKYYKVDFVPIDEQVYYEYAESLLLHVRELVELENGLHFAGNARVAIVLTDEELEEFMAGLKKKAGKACRTLYVGHNVLMASADKRKLQTRDIKINIIPNYYYHELEE